MRVKKEFAIVKGIQGNKTNSRKKKCDLINVIVFHVKWYSVYGDLSLEKCENKSLKTEVGD